MQTSRIRDFHLKSGCLHSEVSSIFSGNDLAIKQASNYTKHGDLSINTISSVAINVHFSDFPVSVRGTGDSFWMSPKVI